MKLIRMPINSDLFLLIYLYLQWYQKLNMRNTTTIINQLIKRKILLLQCKNKKNKKLSKSDKEHQVIGT